MLISRKTVFITENLLKVSETFVSFAIDCPTFLRLLFAHSPVAGSKNLFNDALLGIANENVVIVSFLWLRIIDAWKKRLHIHYTNPWGSGRVMLNLWRLYSSLTLTVCLHFIYDVNKYGTYSCIARDAMLKPAVLN